MNFDPLQPIQKRKTGWNDFRRMNSMDKKKILRLMFLPCDTRRKNIILWIGESVLFISTIFCSLTIGRAAFSSLSYPLWVKTALLIWYLDTCLGMLVSRSIATFEKQLSNRIDTEKNKEADAIRIAIEKLGNKLAEELQIKSGRANVPVDPISMTAAAIDAAHREDKSIQEYKNNPLRAALDNVLLPQDLPPSDDLD